MFSYGSNYPQSHSSYGYQEHYVSSGPPPPPGGFYNQPAYPGSAYSNYSPYGFPGGNTPAIQNMHNSYPLGNQPPPQRMEPPQSCNFTPQAQYQMEMDMQRMMYQQMGYTAPRKPTAPQLYGQEETQDREEEPKRQRSRQQAEVEPEPAVGTKCKDIDEDIKGQMRKIFIDELMRRYRLSATFEMATGTVVPLHTYPESDPVVAFYSKERNEELAGEEWNPEADCEYLRKAMKGLGTDESIITHIVSTRCNAQRQELKRQFKTMYGRDLIEDIKCELSGDYKDAILACFVSPAYYDAKCIKKAIYGLGTDEEALIEIFMTRTNEQIKEIQAVYGEVARPDKKTRQTVMEDDIRGDTSGDFKRLLVSASQGNRYVISREQLEDAVEEILNPNGDGTGMFEVNYTKLCNIKKAKEDAKRLFKAGVDKWGTDEEEFNIIFSTRNFHHLRETYNQYVKLTQADIRNAVDGETSGNFRRGLKAIVECVQNRPRYFAKKLMKSMKGLGTDEETLIRIVASRSEIDMVQIKQEFLQMTKKTLWRYIKEDTSFNVKKILQALVGKD